MGLERDLCHGDVLIGCVGEETKSPLLHELSGKWEVGVQPSGRLCGQRNEVVGAIATRDVFVSPSSGLYPANTNDALSKGTETYGCSFDDPIRSDRSQSCETMQM